MGNVPVHPVVGIGLRRAFDRGDRGGRVPVWSTVIGAVLGVAAVAASATVGATLTRQLDDPEEFGLRWDVELVQFTENTLARAAPGLLAEDDRLRGVAVGISAPVPVNGRTRSVMAIELVRGEVRPPLVRGTYPDAPDAVALGARTLDELGTTVGAEVELDFGAVGGTKRTYRVVGEVIMPPQGSGGRIDEGILLSAGGTARAFAADEPFADTVFLAAAPGVDVDDVIDDLVSGVEMQEPPLIERPTTPSDLVDLGRVRSMPAAFAAAMAVVGVAALGHTLVVSTRRRRHDNAVLRALGFGGRQLHLAVLVQALTLAVVAVAAGVPLGIIIGRGAWDALAESVGSPLPAQAPLLALLVALPLAVLAVAALLAVVPAWLTTRQPTGAVLRTE